MKQKQRSAALKLIGVVVLCACSVPIWLFSAAALDAGVQQAPGSSRADPARGPQPMDSPPPPTATSTPSKITDRAAIAIA